MDLKGEVKMPVYSHSLWIIITLLSRISLTSLKGQIHGLVGIP